MSKSLQEQLLGAGLVDQKKAKAISKEKRKKAKQTPKGHQQEDEIKLAAKQKLAEKAERDRAMNQERQKEIEAKEIQAQIRQLIKQNAISRKDGEVAYSFTHEKKIKKIYVNETLQGQLARGQIAIVAEGEAYELVPKAVADKIAQRDEARVVLQNERSTEVAEEDDPYADYQIPDDLMW
ncbi:DUF2058 domain-containing protein [Pseudoteredinibacter isoporae]|uniref:DUF2058 domain-containing protein n=1 Tax=Pseudoteredinibacter isoporae TaxID=570281 RepID=A0A7X0MUJ6_9GAMM|nr:DUF2058 domain-containing protein [Pseudoteredinibacter isoporae]MBB6520353.1 hypothetical protein [Pseudoteredinibacter isoporae]NHO85923.1 DUF2058 domain-containing protein [Pseudoteredinibacter isoporae]NIB25625.1 DUF2058 domain-containing protein [Pseudoteredinibacter isoporae]